MTTPPAGEMGASLDGVYDRDATIRELVQHSDYRLGMPAGYSRRSRCS